MKNLQQIKDKILKAKKGVYHHMEWQTLTEIDGKVFRKVSSGSVRLGNYYNITHKPQPMDYEENVIKVNRNGVEYVQFFTTGKAPKISYYLNDNQISKEDYEDNVPSSNGKVSIMFSKHLTDIIAFN